MSQARRERGGRCAGCTVAGQGRHEGQASCCLPVLDLQAFAQRDSQTPGLLEAYTCSLLHTMAQSLVFLVLIMSIHVVSHSGEVPIAAPRLLPEVLAEVNWKKTLNLDLGCSKSEKAARRKLRRKGGLRRGSGTHTTSKSYQLQ